MTSKEYQAKKPKVSGFATSLRALHEVWKFDKVYLFKEGMFTIVSRSMPFVISWYSALFINKVTAGSFASLLDPSLIGIVAVFIGLPIIVSIIEIFRDRAYNRFYIDFGQHIDMMMLVKKTELDIQTVEDPAFNDLMTRVRENNHKLRSQVDWIFYVISKGVQVAIAIAVIATYAWWIALIFFAALLPNLYVKIKFGKKVWGIWDAKASTKRRYYEAERHFKSASYMIESRVFGTGGYFINMIKGLIGDFNSEVHANEHKRSKLMILTTLIAYSANASVLLFLMNDIVNGTLLIGTFTFILFATVSLQSEIGGLFNGISHVKTDSLFVADVFKFLSTPEAIQKGDTPLSEETPEIEFKNVSFSYPNSAALVFEKLNFTIKKGDKIAIVGVNGAGKTTLTKLLMRFYDPTEGQVLVGGIDVRDADLESYYKKIGYLSQEYDRYRMSVKEAIAVGDVNRPVNIHDVIEASNKAGSDEFIKDWKADYESNLGREFEGGVEPSIGQWQKLALARLFYRDPQIWILDEPTASIDAVAEMEIFRELEKLPDDKTVILISHRFNTVKNADKIMVLENGQIKEFGSHAKLMAIKGGIYHTLFTSQKDSFN